MAAETVTPGGPASTFSLCGDGRYAIAQPGNTQLSLVPYSVDETNGALMPISNSLLLTSGLALCTSAPSSSASAGYIYAQRSTVGAYDFNAHTELR